MQCARHNRETVVSCGRCDAPVCPRCMVYTDVRIRCRQCAPPQQTSPARSKSVLGGVVVVFLVILAIGYIGSRGGSGADGGYDDYYDEEGYSESALARFAEGVTVDRVEDPWTSNDAEVSAPTGRRFVAFEITIEGPEDTEAGWYVSPMSFKLSDSEGFAYAPTKDIGAEPLLTTIDLDPGEKTRGWLTFDVDEGSDVRSLSYFSIDLKIP